MKPYTQLQHIYRVAKTWEDFLDIVKEGTGKQVLLQVLEEGWRAKVYNDLYNRYKVPTQYIDTLLNRYICLNETTPYQPSAQELAIQLSEFINTINVIRGYLRYAYYVALQDTDEVISVLDETLSQVGTGTPSRKECAESYTIITGKHIDPGVVVMDASAADEVADILAGEIETLLRKLDKTEKEERSQIKQEVVRLNGLHIKLTGRSIVGLDQH